MDMYQKRKMRAEKKKEENNTVRPSSGINCLSLFYLTPYRKPYKIKKN